MTTLPKIKMRIYNNKIVKIKNKMIKIRNKKVKIRNKKVKINYKIIKFNNKIIKIIRIFFLIRNLNQVFEKLIKINNFIYFKRKIIYIYI